MTSKTPLHTVPVPSTDFTTEAYLDGSGVAPAVRFCYFKDAVKHQGGVKFSGVCAIRTRAERCCSAWHIEGAYDTLVEVTGSSWIDEVLTDTSQRWRGKLDLHHYMIYLDSSGCFEVLAASWAAF